MVHDFPDPSKDAGNNDGGDCSLETVSNRFNNCTLQNLIQHIDIYGKIKSTYVDRFKKDSISLSMITASGYRNLSSGKSSTGTLEEKISKLSVSTKVSALYPGHDLLAKKKKLKKCQKVLVR